MGRTTVYELVIKDFSYENNDDMIIVDAFRAAHVGEGAFKDCTSLESIHFGYDIERICFGAFDNCVSLKDVWFNVHDENKIINIDEEAFRNCRPDITFHINALAINNKSLNQYANAHGFRVEKYN